MLPKQKLLKIRLSEKIAKNPKYSKSIGVDYIQNSKNNKIK